LAVLAGQHGHRVSDRSVCVYDVYRVSPLAIDIRPNKDWTCKDKDKDKDKD